MARQSEVANFRENVRRECEKTTQRVVARAAGITPEYLSVVLAGKANPSLQVAENIAHALNLPLAALFIDPDSFTAGSVTQKSIS